MNYFQEYERIKKAKNSIQVDSRWRIITATSGSIGLNTVGRTVTVRSVNMNVIAYSYEPLANAPPLRDFTYERDIDVFKRTFSPIL
jgi:hypothetical protein